MEVGVDYTIRELQPSDRLKNFSTGDVAFQALKTFLLKQACDFHTANIAKTYVAVKLCASSDGILVERADLGVLGYMTLTCSEIDIHNGYTVEDCPYANQYDSLPAVKIARLAVDHRYRGQRIGDAFVALAIAIASDVIAPVIGCRFVVTDAKPEAVRFYGKAGFTLLDTEINRISDTPVMFVDILSLTQSQSS